MEPSSSSWLVSRYRDVMGQVFPSLVKVFHIRTLPRQPLDVVATSTAIPGTPSAWYTSGSHDPHQPRPGTFCVNTAALPSHRTYQCEALVLQNGIPGYHLQRAMQHDPETNVPAIQQYPKDGRYFEAPCRFPLYTAYTEGWALHCGTHLYARKLIV